MTSQIFCVREENSIGLAVLILVEKKIYLLDTHYGFRKFRKNLQQLIKKHSVSEIWINQLGGDEGNPRELSAFKEVPSSVAIAQMKKVVKPVDGRIERDELLAADKLDEERFYAQHQKLVKRIERESPKPPADIAAYFCGLVLIEPPDELVDCIGSFDPYAGGDRRSNTRDAMRLFYG